MKHYAPVFALRFAQRIRRAYWRIFRPVRYGVKGLIFHPADPERVLLVRHTYDGGSKWTLPGGGYSPGREMPFTAFEREVSEEVGVVLSDLRNLTILESTREGKQDTITIVTATAQTPDVQLSSEVVAARWTSIDLVDQTVSWLVKEAVGVYREQ